MAEWAVLTWQPVVWLTGVLGQSQVEVWEERKAVLRAASVTFYVGFVSFSARSFNDKPRAH